MLAWSMVLDVLRGLLFALSHVFGGSLGLGIIGLSVLVRLVLLPWSLRAARRGHAMRLTLKSIEPRILELKRRHAKNPAKLRAAVLAEYQKAGVNPMRDSGLAITAVQIPIGFALYTVIRSSVTSAGFLWIANLARPDVLISLIATALSVVMGLTMATNGAPGSSAMPWIIGLATFFFVFNVSAGLALYWAATSAVGTLQNVLLKRSISPAT
jgi:YidC/Oxa1 family membrane protein insertase